jgi:hypothetical protein
MRTHYDRHSSACSMPGYMKGPKKPQKPAGKRKKAGKKK